MGRFGRANHRTLVYLYGTIIQSRDWLPDAIGGVEWLAMDNIATSIYIPVYAGTSDLPQSHKTPGRDGYTRKSAWWAFNRMSTLTAQRWGDMRHDVDAVFVPMQKELFANAPVFEKEVLELYNKNPKQAKEKLTEYTMTWGNKVVDEAWQLGDDLWTKYDEKF